MPRRIHYQHPINAYGDAAGLWSCKFSGFSDVWTIVHWLFGQLAPHYRSLAVKSNLRYINSCGVVAELVCLGSLFTILSDAMAAVASWLMVFL